MGSGFTKQKVCILVVGLDNSGKTTIIQKLKNQKQQIDVAPTVGFNQDQFEKYNLNFTFYDMSGQSSYRDMWESNAKQADAIIFVIDSSDKFRFSVMANEFEIIQEYKVMKIPILFYANKSDIKDGENAQYFINYLKLDQIKDRSWHMQSTSATSGTGIEEGLVWLSQKLQQINKIPKK